MDKEPNVLECRFAFERGVCELHVKARRTTQGEPVFAAYAFEAEDANHELRRVLNENSNHLEVLGSTPHDAAERLAQSLEQRYGARLSGPDAVPDLSSPYVIK